VPVPCSELEAAFRASHGLDQYNDNVVHYPPLVVIALQHAGAWLPWILPACDTLTAVFLTKLHTAAAPDTAWVTAALSSLGPVFVLSTGSGSVSVVARFWVAAALYLAVCARKTFYAGAAAAAAAYMNPCYVLMVVPVAVAVGRPAAATLPFSWPRCICAVAGWTVAGWGLLHASASMFGSWEFFSAVYAWRVWHSDITPNCGMSWYFFAEVLRFHRYYRLVFLLFPCAFVSPLVIWFHKQPVILAAAVLTIRTFACAFRVFVLFSSSVTCGYSGLVHAVSHSA
jgi:hypothetical protein